MYVHVLVHTSTLHVHTYDIHMYLMMQLYPVCRSVVYYYYSVIRFLLGIDDSVPYSMIWDWGYFPLFIKTQ